MHQIKYIIRYDVWICYVNGRTSYRATLYKESAGENWPGFAIGHLDVVWARNKREATQVALKANKV